jgi:hypothetical protein
MVFQVPAAPQCVCGKPPWCDGGAPLSHTHDHAAAGPRSLTNRIDGFYDRRLQRSNLEKPVKKSIDSDRRTSRTSGGVVEHGRGCVTVGRHHRTMVRVGTEQESSGPTRGFQEISPPQAQAENRRLKPLSRRAQVAVNQQANKQSHKQNKSTSFPQGGLRIW